MLRPERERVGEIGVELGGALAGDAVDEVERDVVKSGITKMMHGASDVVGPAAARARAAARAGTSARRARRDSRPRRAAARASSGVTVSGFASTVTSPRGRQRASSRTSSGSAVKVGVPPPRNTVSSSGEHVALQLELAQQRIDVRPVLIPRRPTDRDEVAVAAAMGAERQVRRRGGGRRSSLHQLFCPWPMLSTARNASCGTSTAPTCFIRFLPSFCFSSSLRLREMSPP